MEELKETDSMSNSELELRLWSYDHHFQPPPDAANSTTTTTPPQQLQSTSPSPPSQHSTTSYDSSSPPRTTTAAASISSAVPPGRKRKMPEITLAAGKTPIIPPPYPWATDRRANIHDLNYLVENNLVDIKGSVKCKGCEKIFEISYNVVDKFVEISSFITLNQVNMDTRAPSIWMNPKLPDCQECGQTNCAKPIMPRKKKEINWLFLMCGQMLGCCKLSQLKYFCKHTRNHRTGAKDRVLYLTYLGVCKMLYPGKLSMFSGVFKDDDDE